MEQLTDQQLRDAIIEAVSDGDRHDALHYARRWAGVQPDSDIETLRKALESARDELKRQREIWTGSKNDSWAIAAIDTELKRIERALA